MRGFRYCAGCSWRMRLIEGEGEFVDLVVYVGVKGFLCELVLVVSDCVVVLHRWFYRVSFREKLLQWEVEGWKLEAEEERFFEDVERLRGGGEWRRVALER